MFNSPSSLARAIKNRDRLVRAEQNCLNDRCAKWFDVPVGTVQQQLALAEAGGGVPFVHVKCSHCGESHIVLLPGKYDSLTSKRPGQQRYTFAEKP